MDWDWMERSAEQICLDFDGQISETEDWEAICILPNDEFCYMFDIEDGGCDLLWYEYEYEWDMPSSVYCEENWWTYQIWLEWGEEQEVCTFDDNSFCYFDDLVAWNCSKWEFYYDEDEVEEYDAIYATIISAYDAAMYAYEHLAIENTCDENDHNKKVLHNGILTIERNGHTFNALGTEIK